MTIFYNLLSSPDRIIRVDMVTELHKLHDKLLFVHEDIQERRQVLEVIDDVLNFEVN